MTTYDKKRTTRRIEAGLCPRCGKELQLGYKTCEACRQYFRQNKQKSYEKRVIVAANGKLPKLQEKETLCKCDYCSKATAVLCRWLSHKDKDGRVVIEKTVSMGNYKAPHIVGMVIECEQFNDGDLPPITGNA